MFSQDEMERLVDSAVEVLYRTHRASAAHLARRLEISRRRAAELMGELAKREIIARDVKGVRYLVSMHDMRLHMLKRARPFAIRQLVAFAKDAAGERGYVTSEELCDWVNALKPEPSTSPECVVVTVATDVDDIILDEFAEAGLPIEAILRRLAAEGIRVVSAEEVEEFGHQH